MYFVFQLEPWVTSWLFWIKLKVKLWYVFIPIVPHAFLMNLSRLFLILFADHFMYIWKCINFYNISTYKYMQFVWLLFFPCLAAAWLRTLSSIDFFFEREWFCKLLFYLPLLIVHISLGHDTNTRNIIWTKGMSRCKERLGQKICWFSQNWPPWYVTAAHSYVVLLLEFYYERREAFNSC